MDFEIKPFADLSLHLENALKTNFGFQDNQVKRSIQLLNNFLANTVTGLFCGIESSYIDFLYRDEYYHYYSSKLKSYNRDCMRVSFFNQPVSYDDFFSEEGAKSLQSKFMGFLVLRPTPQNIIGRNLLRPDFFQKTNYQYAAISSTNVLVNGIKLDVEGFPHASQDAEFMVCAETTLWSVMEYFSHRYPDYTPILPRKIHSLLSATSMQRQVPSSGLTGLQISYALKELGFGVKMYSANSYTEKGLEEIIKIYVESGIPVITAIANGNGIAHVITLMGRTDFNLSAGFRFSVMDKLASGSEIFNYYEQPFRYLTIDDNHPPYISIPLNNPAENYSNAKWANCKIYAAIVPLHRKIYMEADKAKELALQTLKMYDPVIKLPQTVFRILLSSSRSFKNSVALNKDLDKTAKILIANLDMPKFVWIAEVGTVASFQNGKATGMLLIDATEPQKAEMLAYFAGNVYIGPINGKIGRYILPLQPFSIHHNLKPF